VILSDVTMQSLQASLAGLNLRRQVAEDNIANIETPNYKAKKVDFEASLRKAIGNANPAAAQPTVSNTSAPGRMNGNNVSVDLEMVGLTETALRHQLVVEAMNSKFRLLRSAISGQ